MSKGKKTGGKRRKTQEEFEQEIYNLVADEYTVLGEYTGTHNKLLMRHNTCGYEWGVRPHSFLEGHFCFNCAIQIKNKSKTKSQERFINEVYNLVGSEYDVLGEYINSVTSIKIKHNKCGYEYEVRPANFLSGRRCPYCAESKGEQEIRKFISINNINFIQYKIFDNLLGVNNGFLSYDFYLPDFNLLIEYQGEFHDGTAYQQTEVEYLIQQEHDKRKNEYAKQNSIKLLEIWYWDFAIIEDILTKELDLISSSFYIT